MLTKSHSKKSNYQILFFLNSPKRKSMAEIKISHYSHSPIHLFTILNDIPRLTHFLTSLPKLSPPSQIHTLSDSLIQSKLADKITAAVDRRDVPGGDTALHLAVRLSNLHVSTLLLQYGADPSLQNSSGWTPLQESLSLQKNRRLSSILVKYHRLSAFKKFRRRLPALLNAISNIRDFYMEVGFNFESSVIPFLSKAAPSDVYKIWKRGEDLRVDMTMAGFDGLRVKRVEQSFLFFGSSKSLIILNRTKKEIRDAFEGLECVSDEMIVDEDDDLVEDASAYRPGLDITNSELVGVMNWRRKERIDSVGEWKAKVYEMHNVVFSFKTMKGIDDQECEENNVNEDCLELDDEVEDGYIVADIQPTMNMQARHSCCERGSSEAKFEFVKSRRSLDLNLKPFMKREERGRIGNVVAGVRRKEKEMVKNLRPIVWLTEEFPLKTEELIPLLDILASKVKAVRRLRELLTSKFPHGTFPVKVSIPIVPTVRVVVTFTKFVNLQPPEQFFTPFSSPRYLSTPHNEEHQQQRNNKGDNIIQKSSSWLKWGHNSPSTKSFKSPSNSINPTQVVNYVDTFSIPCDYTWIKNRTVRSSSKSRKGKQR